MILYEYCMTFTHPYRKNNKRRILISPKRNVIAVVCYTIIVQFEKFCYKCVYSHYFSTFRHNDLSTPINCTIFSQRFNITFISTDSRTNLKKQKTGNRINGQNYFAKTHFLAIHFSLLKRFTTVRKYKRPII